MRHNEARGQNEVLSASEVIKGQNSQQSQILIVFEIRQILPQNKALS